MSLAGTLFSGSPIASQLCAMGCGGEHTTGGLIPADEFSGWRRGPHNLVGRKPVALHGLRQYSLMIGEAWVNRYQRSTRQETSHGVAAQFSPARSRRRSAG